jgi:DNA mismatch repair protein MutS
VRHPIIEQIHTDIPYISNDLGLGNNKDGLLIYGINSSGKSSLMKSIGLCIIMAQSGMYVPAKEFEYSPYKSIFTRIGIQDNIFTGRSSFTQEMYELRNIFNNADENSLIIGDEICNGTEECSALSLVASTIKILSEKKSTFIFATHLHRLVELDVINNIDNLLIKHLKITHKNGLLIYNRTLDEGNGSQEYGIMVAQTLNMPDEFIKYANNVRTIVKNEVNIFDAKSNRYNSAKFSTVCQICEENYNEIHHIKFQKDANQYKYVNDTYLNDKYNLVALCSQCHDKIHNDKIIINGFIETSQGVKLDYK